MEPEFNVSIIGAGRFGTFWGKELSIIADVVYYDREGNSVGLKRASLKECFERRFIFLAIPISEVENFVAENGVKIAQNSILIDLSSVKMHPEKCFERYLPERNGFILAHPLFGPDSASGGVKGHRMAVTLFKCPKEAENEFRALLTAHLGVEIVELSSGEHDRLMALNLSLMHHLGRAFNLMGIEEVTLKMRSLTEISKISRFVMNDREQMFKDFYKYNPYSQLVKEEFLEAFLKVSP